ncbi:MAG: hypothetical protein QOF78_2825, partial [Phycisphaerales bacterium]|nr:hypothetical protein [Phycisphaerales bacterium]
LVAGPVIAAIAIALVEVWRRSGAPAADRS